VIRLINERQTHLLKLIVEDYIKTAKPVSSKSLCELMNCSSATIRNEMSNLEELGLLEKTHTSSGRVPSEKGYRYYVDYIMKPSELTGEDMLKLQTIFHNNSLAISDTIKLSMQLVADITNCTTITLGAASRENRVNRVMVEQLDDQNMIAIVITDKGHVEHKNIHFAEQVDQTEIKKTVDLINKLIVGTPIDQVSERLEYEVKPVITKVVRQHEVLYNAFYNAFHDFAKGEEVRVTSASNMLKQPEFNDADKIREIISKFDDKNMVSNIKEDENGINIYIGSETEFDNDVSIIKTRYTVSGEEGTIALVGPKRMEYGRVISLLEYIKDNLG
jgi:heat-inducible transcriptional repressor